MEVEPLRQSAENDFVKQVEDTLTLRDSNYEACISFEQVNADCELNSIVSANHLDEKITSDLGLLEAELFSTLGEARELVSNLREEITAASVDPETEQGEKTRCEEYVETLIQTEDLFSILVQNFTKTKAVQSSLPPILNMGGYRSLMLCMIDTLTLVIRSLKQKNVTNVISRTSKAFVSSIGFKFKRKGSSSDEKKSTDDSLLLRRSLYHTQPGEWKLGAVTGSPGEHPLISPRKRNDKECETEVTKESLVTPPKDIKELTSQSVGSIVRKKRKKKNNGENEGERDSFSPKLGKRSVDSPSRSGSRRKKSSRALKAAQDGTEAKGEAESDSPKAESPKGSPLAKETGNSPKGENKEVIGDSALAAEEPAKDAGDNTDKKEIEKKSKETDKEPVEEKQAKEETVEEPDHAELSPVSDSSPQQPKSPALAKSLLRRSLMDSPDRTLNAEKKKKSRRAKSPSLSRKAKDVKQDENLNLDTNEENGKDVVPLSSSLESDVLEDLNSKKDIQKFYQAKKEQIRAEYQQEREKIQLTLKALDEAEKSTLASVEKEEKEKLKQLKEKEPEVSSAIVSTKKREYSFRLYKTQIQRCKKAGNMINNLCSKLAVCALIKEGEVFMDISEMYKNSNYDPATVFVESHFGYEIDHDLKEYSKKMKVVYCAVDSSIKENKGSISAAIQKQMQFSYSAMRYMVKPKDASEKYGNLLKEKLDIKFVRGVWDLLEDPMTSFFATQFGFAPAMERMKVNLEVRIPVKAGEIFNEVNEQQKTLYRTRSRAFSSLALPKRDTQDSDDKNDEKKTSDAEAVNSDSAGKQKKEKKQEKKEKKEKKKEENSTEQVFASNIALPVGEPGNESYLIRCRFLNPFDNPVDPSLVIKLNTRANFMAKDQAEVKKVPDTLTRIFGKNLTNTPTKKRKLQASQVSDAEDAEQSPGSSGPDTLIIHIHGGGWVSQSPDQHVSYISEWAKMTNAPVLSIDYSLSPEVKFPISPNECYAIYKWLLVPENAAKLGLSTEPLKIVVCGDSAGGNLTCALVLKAIREGIRLPVGLLLHYPAGILSASGSLSRMIFSNDPILNYQTMRVVLDCYLGDLQKQAKTVSLISPAFAPLEELKKFPTTVICCGDVDPLIDDSTFMYDRLQSVGVHTILRIYRGLPHGFLNLPTQLPKAVGAIRAAGVYMDWLFNQSQDCPVIEDLRSSQRST